MKWAILPCLPRFTWGLGCSPAGPPEVKVLGAWPPRGCPGCGLPPFSMACVLPCPTSWGHCSMVSSLRDGCF